jgi:cysteine desulfuration protein SufE
MTLAEKQRRLSEELDAIEDAHERLASIVSRTRRLKPLLESERTEAHRVRGCVSPVWLVGELQEGRCYFRCDADGPLVKGLVALLCDFFSGAPPDEIVSSDADPLAALGLTKNLSPTRRNGLASARAAILSFASAHHPGN